MTAVTRRERMPSQGGAVTVARFFVWSARRKFASRPTCLPVGIRTAGCDDDQWGRSRHCKLRPGMCYRPMLMCAGALR